MVNRSQVASLCHQDLHPQLSIIYQPAIPSQRIWVYPLLLLGPGLNSPASEPETFNLLVAPGSDTKDLLGGSCGLNKVEAERLE